VSPASIFLLPLSLALLLAGGCSRPLQGDVSRLAASAGVREQVVEGRGFRHRLFANQQADAQAGTGPLLVYLEGDGTPWTHGGRREAVDPTPQQPLAFHLFQRTALPAWYITRPCYSGLRDADCRPSLWTSGRYSATVVDSLAAALDQQLQQHGRRQIILVGYSGGGALATLLAARLPDSVGVVTLAANLDLGAWTALHGYLPLDQSLDPASQPPLHGKVHVLLAGGRDTQVPLSSVAGYLDRHPETVVISYPRFDHRCCWAAEWETILPAALQHLVY
jgi:pimeloyl-ACP methyl ester carboxylesterase